MRTFIYFNFVLGCIGILARAFLISVKDHPRLLTYSKGEDVFYLLLGIGFTVWAGILLFGG
jgi:hypothetical protein